MLRETIGRTGLSGRKSGQSFAESHGLPAVDSFAEVLGKGKIVGRVVVVERFESSAGGLDP